MQTLTAVAGIALMALLWLTILAKVFIVVLRAIRPKYMARWLVVLGRIVPSWRLFGQGGATFDLYEVIADRKLGEEEEHFHSTYGRTRRWFHPIMNPYSRYRYLLREKMQSSMYYHLSGIPKRPANLGAETILEEVVKSEVRRLHPSDHSSRSAHLYVVFDRGYFSKDAAEVKVTLGPFEG